MNRSVRLFISHWSGDEVYVKLLIDLLRSALNLPAEQIRCTSVDGYRLPIGADTDDHLRMEIENAETFIGVISKGSLKSLFVLFELGARWGARKRLNPLLAPGTEPSVLSGPLTRLNALGGGKPAQLHQLVQDLANQLSISPSTPAVFQANIDAITSFTQTTPATTPTLPELVEEPQFSEHRLSPEAKELLIRASEDSHGWILCVTTSGGTTIQIDQTVLNEPQNPRSVAAWRAALDSLCRLTLLEKRNKDVYAMTHHGYLAADRLKSSQRLT